MSDMYVTNYRIRNLTLVDANTEYSQALSEGASYFEIKARSLTADLKISFVSGESGTTYFSIPGGGTWYTKGRIPATITVYAQSPTSGAVVEIIEAR